MRPDVTNPRRVLALASYLATDPRPIPMFMSILSVMLLAQESTVYVSQPTGAEWMVYASIIVPAVLLGALAYLSRNSTV